MRRVAGGLAWAVLLLALAAVGLYVGLMVTRGISPPVVPVEPGEALPGLSRGDAVLLRDVAVDDIHRGDIIAVRGRGTVLLGVVETADQEGSTVEYVLTGLPDGEPLDTDHHQVVGAPARRVPGAGWLLIPLRQRPAQIATAIVGGLLVLGLLVGRQGYQAPLGEPVWADDDLALPPGRERPRAGGPVVDPGPRPFVVGPPGAQQVEEGPRALPPAGPSVPYGDPPMGITPDDLRQVRFAQTRKGYDTEAVDRALDTVADSIEHLLQERQQLVERIQSLEAEVQRYKGMEASLGQTLAMAERTAEELKAEAQAEAQRIVRSAQQQAASGPQQQGAVPAEAMVQLLGETRAIRSLLQAVLQGQRPPQPPPPPPPQQPGYPPAPQPPRQ